MFFAHAAQCMPSTSNTFFIVILYPDLRRYVQEEAKFIMEEFGITIKKYGEGLYIHLLYLYPSTQTRLSIPFRAFSHMFFKSRFAGDFSVISLNVLRDSSILFNSSDLTTGMLLLPLPSSASTTYFTVSISGSRAG